MKIIAAEQWQSTSSTLGFNGVGMNPEQAQTFYTVTVYFP